MSEPTPPRYRELTVSSVIFGVLFGCLMNMAITYAGLKIGFTIVGSAIAAVVGFGVLRGLLRRGTILEINIAQAIASGINCTCAGVIFTVPVLFLLNRPLDTKDIVVLALAGAVGGVLGVAFIVPLRKQMIDIDRLRFPSGTAVASILKAPGAGPKKSLVLLLGIGAAVLIYLPVELPNLKINGEPLWGYGDIDWRLPDPRTNPTTPLPPEVDRDGDGRPDLILTHKTLDVGRLIGLPDYVLLVFAITPLSFGAGYLAGRAGLMALAGGVLAVFVLNPAAYLLDWMPATLPAYRVPEYAQSAFDRPLGIGMLLGGALLGVIFALPAIRAAFKSIGGSGKLRQGSDELGLRPILLSAGVGVALLFVATDVLGSGESQGGLLSGLDPHLRSLIIALVGAVWIWFAGVIIAQCTGMTDWSPISGMALLTVVLVLALAGPNEVATAVLLGAALCVACSEAADMMADLKTGYLVGSSPRRLQIAQLATAWLGPVVSICTLLLIVASNERAVNKPLGPGTETVAPQAQALQAVVTGVQGGEMPYALYALGGTLGVALGLGAFPGLGVLIGLSMYLPIIYILTYGLGCLTNMAVGRIKGKAWAEEWGVPFCAGLIVGEALLALVANGIVLLQG